MADNCVCCDKCISHCDYNTQDGMCSACFWGGRHVQERALYNRLGSWGKAERALQEIESRGEVR